MASTAVNTTQNPEPLQRSGEKSFHSTTESESRVNGLPNLKESLPPVSKFVETPSDANSIRDQIQDLGRRARDSFRDACNSLDEMNAEQSLDVAKTTLDELWKFAKYRDRAFQDLLAIIEPALKRREISDFNSTQRDILRTAFTYLPQWMIDYDVVEELTEKFAEHDIDITGPITTLQNKRFKITIEEID